MSTMVRKQVYVEPRQETLLKRRARELKVTQAELIRRGIDALDRGVPPSGAEPKAWEAAKAVIRRRMRRAAPQTGRRWTRKELYEERLERLAR